MINFEVYGFDVRHTYLFKSAIKKNRFVLVISLCNIQ
jgi:hypothetical protein